MDENDLKQKVSNFEKNISKLLGIKESRAFHCFFQCGKSKVRNGIWPSQSKDRPRNTVNQEIAAKRFQMMVISQ